MADLMKNEAIDAGKVKVEQIDLFTGPAQPELFAAPAPILNSSEHQ